MPNPFVHVELMANDVAKAKSFYSKLFEWQMKDMEMGELTYTMISVGEGTGGGLMKNTLPGAPSAWVAYVEVDDVDAAAEKAQSLGAAIVKGPQDVKGAGRFAIITDPTGATLGLWESKR